MMIGMFVSHPAPLLRRHLSEERVIETPMIGRDRPELVYRVNEVRLVDVEAQRRPSFLLLVDLGRCLYLFRYRQE